MIDQLDQVDWSSMNADIVPLWLRNLLPDFRSNDFQGTHEATSLFFYNPDEDTLNFQDFNKSFPERRVIAFIVPFLVDLVKRQDLKTKDLVLRYLGFIAEYKRYISVNQQHHLSYAKELSELVWQGKDAYIATLENGTRQEKSEAAYLLIQFTDHLSTVFPILAQRVSAEDDEMKRIILRHISKYISFEKSDEFIRETAIRTFSPILYSLTKSDSADSSKISSVLGLIDIHASNVDTSVVDLLSDYIITKPNQLRSVFNWDLQERHIGVALIKLGDKRGIPVCIKIFNSSPDESFRLIALCASLAMAFLPEYDPSQFALVEFSEFGLEKKVHGFDFILPDYTPPVLTVPNTLQKKVIETMFNDDWLWKLDSNANHRFGLPSRRDDLRKLL